MLFCQRYSFLLRDKAFKTCFKSKLYKISTYVIQYKEYGDPEKVLEKVECEIPDDLKSNQVLIKMLAAPINPADINMIQGKYAIKLKLPAVGGNEGVAEILKIGTSVQNLKVGTWVIPANAGTGTWKTHGIYDEKELIQIDNNIPLLSAATVSVNPCTAFRMLQDFVTLQEGDTVIQNGANSAVGQAVIQIAKHLKVNTINIIRDRPDLGSLKSYLSNLGATHVVVENELRSPVMSDIFKQIPKPLLGFNCVGGKSASELIRQLQDKGTLVTYGGMSKQPITLSTASLIFNDVHVRGFWMTKWNELCSKDERTEMLSQVTNIIRKGALRAPVMREVKLNQFKDAISKSMTPYVSEKQILVMD